MLTGFYTAASGMLTQQRMLNTAANNISNVSTPGYKEDQVVVNTFEKVLTTRQEGGKSVAIGKGSSVRTIHDVPSQLVQGGIDDTQRELDFALDGEGFFTILGTDGETYYTRNGNFVVDDEGYLALKGLGRVQGTNGDLLVGESEFTVTEQGSVFDKFGKNIGIMSINAPSPTTVLNKSPNGLFRIDPDPALTPEQMQAQLAGNEVVRPEPVMNPVFNTKVYQGKLEASNVDYNRSVSLLIETQRNFQSCSKALQMIDKINQKTANIAAL